MTDGNWSRSLTTAGSNRGDSPLERTGAAAPDEPHGGLVDRVEAADEPAPPAIQGDKVLEASWESFPASDAPAWTAAERPTSTSVAEE
jgi:hypothetical protein